MNVIHALNNNKSRDKICYSNWSKKFINNIAQGNYYITGIFF